MLVAWFDFQTLDFMIQKGHSEHAIYHSYKSKLNVESLLEMTVKCDCYIEGKLILLNTEGSHLNGTSKISYKEKII